MNEPTKTRILLVDDHFIMRLGLATAINEEADMMVVGQCNSGEQAIELFRQHRPDVTVMDLLLPGISGIDATAAIRKHCPEARIILFSAYETEEDVFRATEAGAVAYLAKSIDPTELMTAVRSVHSGRTYFPPGIAAKLAARSPAGIDGPRDRHSPADCAGPLQQGDCRRVEDCGEHGEESLEQSDAETGGPRSHRSGNGGHRARHHSLEVIPISTSSLLQVYCLHCRR